MDIAESREILARTPAVLTSLLQGVSEPWRRANEGPDTFSAHDVVGHLLYGEETDWMPRLRRILEHGTSVPFDPFDRVGFRRYGDAGTDELLRRFAELRHTNLAELDRMSLGAADLERQGRHPALGAVTVGQLIATWAVHDLNHVAQATRVMARRYEAAVGPWKEYLGLLHWRTR